MLNNQAVEVLPSVIWTESTGHFLDVWKANKKNVTDRLLALLTLAGFNTQFECRVDPKTPQERGLGTGIAIQLPGNDSVRLVLSGKRGNYRFNIFLYPPQDWLNQIEMTFGEFEAQLRKAIITLNDYWAKNPRERRNAEYDPLKMSKFCTIHSTVRSENPAKQEIGAMISELEVIVEQDEQATLAEDQPSVRPEVRLRSLMIGFLDAALVRQEGSDPCGYHDINKIVGPVAHSVLSALNADECSTYSVENLSRQVRNLIRELTKEASEMPLEVMRERYVRRRNGQYATRVSAVSWLILRSTLPELLMVRELGQIEFSIDAALNQAGVDRRALSKNLHFLKEIGVIADYLVTAGSATFKVVPSLNPPEMAVYPAKGTIGGVACRLDDPANWLVADAVAKRYLGLDDDDSAVPVEKSLPVEADGESTGNEDQVTVHDLALPERSVGGSHSGRIDQWLEIDLEAVMLATKNQLAQLEPVAKGFSELLDLQGQVNNRRLALGLHAIESAADQAKYETITCQIETVRERLTQIEKASQLRVRICSDIVELSTIVEQLDLK